MEEITIRGTRAQQNLMEWSRRVADCRGKRTGGLHLDENQKNCRRTSRSFAVLVRPES